MPRSEIDDIFASKGKSKAIHSPVASSSSLQEKKKINDKKRKRDSAADTGTLSASAFDKEKVTKPPPRKPPAPETVVDPSTCILSAKLIKCNKSTGGRDVINGRKHGEKDDKERFKDSRGSGPRRKTEEGWAIYNEGELGIGDEGGDTPLCPFDCECCY